MCYLPAPFTVTITIILTNFRRPLPSLNKVIYYNTTDSLNTSITYFPSVYFIFYVFFGTQIDLSLRDSMGPCENKRTWLVYKYQSLNNAYLRDRDGSSSRLCGKVFQKSITAAVSSIRCTLSVLIIITLLCVCVTE